MCCRYVNKPEKKFEVKAVYQLIPFTNSYLLVVPSQSMRIEGERDVYEAATDYSAGMYLVANPAWNYEVYKATDRNEENYINKAGIAFRAYRLEKDMKYKVYNLDLATPFVVGDGVKFEGGKYAKDEGGSPKLKVVAVEEVGFPFCVGSGGTEVSGYGYAVGETMKKYTIEVVA